jgi:hypothetical protein
MNRLDPHDPRPLLALVLAILVLWLSRHLSGLSPSSLLSSTGGLLAPIALGALVLASALAIQRLVLTDRTLRTRRELAVIPADDFDPKPDAVLRFAAELVSTQRSTFGWLDRRATAVRVRLTRDPSGRLVYLLGVPERSARLLRAALETYSGIEVRDADDVLVGGDPDQKLASVRAELVLGRTSLEPLARLALDPDPLQPFATALASGRPAPAPRSACASTSCPPRDDGASACDARCVAGRAASSAAASVCSSGSKEAARGARVPDPTSCSAVASSTNPSTRSCATRAPCSRPRS